MASEPNYAQLLNYIYSHQCLPYDTVPSSSKNVSDALTPEISKWKIHPVLINAPTGSGKSTFVFHQLADFAAQAGRYVLVLSNRLALNLQQKANLCDLYGLPYIGSKALAEIKLFRNIILLTYQSVLQELNSGRLASLPIKYIVLDEAHFFCSDSVFNPWTGFILSALQRTFPKAVRIYMSATPENVKPMLAALETYHLNTLPQRLPGPNYDITLDLLLKTNTPKILEYKFQPNFQNISLIFFYHWDSLLDTIQESFESPEKWLIFVSEKNTGKSLKQILGNNYADYIDADSPPRQITMLSKRQRFTKKVLISTSVIDNGLSIHDRDLTHVVVDTLDRISMIQMLGRKRLTSDEKICLYVKLPSEVEQISNYRQAMENLHATIVSYEKNPSGFVTHNWGGLTAAQQKLFAPSIQNGRMFLHTNVFAKYQLELKCSEFEQLEEQLEQDEFAFTKQVCSWFHKDFSKNMILDNSPISDAVEKMTAILNTKLDFPITAEHDIIKVADELKACLSTSELKKLKFKNDTANRAASEIRKLLTVYHLPFELSKKRNGVYYIYPIPSE